MPQLINPSDNAVTVLRFVRALALACFGVVALAVTVAMFWRDIALASFFDRWFGNWSEGSLTLLTVALDAALYIALRVTMKSEAKLKRRSQHL